MELAEIVERVKKIKAKIPNEESTKLHVILPTLKALGWDIFNPDELMPETRTEEGRPDYALKINGRTVAFLEAKSVRERIFTDGRVNSKHARQLARYCFDRGVDLGILTNGLQWALIKAYEPGKSVEERVILAVDLMNQSMEEVIERLRWLSKDFLLKYVNIPREYAKIPTPTPTGGEDYPKQEASKEGYQFKTLYVSAQEVEEPPSAVLVRELFGKDLKDCFPRAVFVNVNGRWYRVQISYGEQWRGLKLAWSSVTSVVVRFLMDKGIRDFPEVGKYLSRVPRVSDRHWNAVARIGDLYLYLPENGKKAVEVLRKIEESTGTEIALEILGPKCNAVS
ncbi:type I restriction endonuclease [Thermococcus gorgonarius]|uniref:Restriction endonuclease type I HsdR N-terminal domain-containing protein n=1 Tax=Thermococcus gorgonarius TaxID=71997 RepID=A0A2Z2M8W7_THEGO|nr:type I restriction endonuclease [Thermococcus gorgonarius]ASJ00344.1 hypothetical protein A3K92_02030 [Thermococcus gorgonarius]